MSEYVDGILKEWGDREYTPIKARVRNIRGGKVKKPPRPKPSMAASATKAAIARTVAKSPEVMVKISGGGKNMGSIKAHMDYISRNGELELEDEQGALHKGRDALLDLRDDWAISGVPIPEHGDKRREAFNIILSMPPGTDRKAVTNAARAFAVTEFGNHQFVFATHDDEEHPHVHLAVKATDHDGVRLNPRKADLQQWRELFAEKLRDFGVEANATPRHLRGVVKRPEKQAVRHINLQFKQGKRKASARTTKSQAAAARQEANGGAVHENPADTQLKLIRGDTEQLYGRVAKALVRSDAKDRELALGIVNFVKAMPPVLTQHQSRVAALKAKASPKQIELTRKSPVR